MNELENDLRTLLHQKGGAAGAPMPDARLLRRARRRQLGTILGGGIVAAAIVVGAIVVISALASGDGTTPAVPTELTETALNGITITHPEGWYVVDPVEAGIEPTSEDLPRLVLFVSDADPVASGTLGCPGLVDGTADGFVFTVQQTPLALAGEAARVWPVDLVPMEIDASGPGCYPGWTFLRASWTANGRSFEARTGIGPDVSGTDRQALGSAFASMRFEPTEGPPRAAVIATGTAGGEDWELIISRGSDGLELGLEWRNGGSGIGGFSDDPEGLELASHAFGTGDDREVVVFGVAPIAATRVEVVTSDGAPAVSSPTIDPPDALGGRLTAFVIAYRPDPANLAVELNAYDEDGQLLATTTVASSSQGASQPAQASPAGG